jgi:hypothetical protein
MKTYWDLSERERAELTEEQVRPFTDVELMNKGVLRVAPLELLPVPARPAPDVEVFSIRGASTDQYFSTEADARAVMALTVPVTRKYLGGNWSGPSALVLGDKNPDRSVEPVGIYTPETYGAAIDAITRASQALEENDRRTKQHDKDIEAQREALGDLWSDWHRCGAKASRMQRVHETYLGYVKMSDGDSRIAAKFLAKAFTGAEIEDACEWFGLTIDGFERAEAKAEPAPSETEQAF